MSFTISGQRRTRRRRSDDTSSSDIEMDVQARASATTVMALREARQRYEQIFVGAPIGMALVNVHGSFLKVNRALSRTVGYTEEELVGRRFLEMIHADDRAVIERLLDPTIRHAPANDEAEIRFTRYDGRLVWLLASAAPNLDEDTQTGHFIVHLQDVTEHRRARDEIHEAHARLTQTVAELERNHREILLINEMTHFLEAADSATDVTQVVARFAKQLFPDGRGVLYLLRAGLFGEAVRWGNGADTRGTSGRQSSSAPPPATAPPSPAGDADRGVANIDELSPGSALRVPLIVQEQTIGMLSWEPEPVDDATAHQQRAEELAINFAGHVGLALANVNLRETLREESIRDAVTELFNRRYMEESLAREMIRAKRNDRALSVIAVDIDHFKQFNDRHGHEAGDYVLRAVAAVLQDGIRQEDIACRSGGEEFLLIMPEAALGIAVQRAEELRTAIAALTVDYRGVTLGPITISLGASAFPDHGDAGDVVVRAADAALYRAKRLGRDQTVVASRTETLRLT